MKLSRQFFNRPTLTVACQLLGKYLIRKINGKTVRAKITETEAYCGQKDKACHASKGLTPRTKVMFGPPGHAYIYMIYGMYYCLNIVTEKESYPAAILIRSLELMHDPLQTAGYKHNAQSEMPNISLIKLNGPGKLCRELKINKKLNGIDLTKSKELWLEDSKEKIVSSRIKKGKRIGVDYAGKWKNKLWRFYID